MSTIPQLSTASQIGTAATTTQSTNNGPQKLRIDKDGFAIPHPVTPLERAVNVAKRKFDKAFSTNELQEEQPRTKLYRAQEGFVNLDSARQSTIDPSESHHYRIGKGGEEDRLGKAAASANSQNLTERGKYVRPRNSESLTDDLQVEAKTPLSVRTGRPLSPETVFYTKRMKELIKACNQAREERDLREINQRWGLSLGVRSLSTNNIKNGET